MSKLKDLSDTLHYIVESLRELDRISRMHSCNDCAKLGGICEYMPEWGESVRYNCPHWDNGEEK